jgi:hypothetical protein
MSRSNADRQRAYRERRRNARNAAAVPISPAAVQPAESYYDSAGFEHWYICTIRGERIYALVTYGGQPRPPTGWTFGT